jgi:hypothetical protein
MTVETDRACIDTPAGRTYWQQAAAGNLKQKSRCYRCLSSLNRLLPTEPVYVREGGRGCLCRRCANTCRWMGLSG